jgi:hypothetical protein
LANASARVLNPNFKRDVMKLLRLLVFFILQAINRYVVCNLLRDVAVVSVNGSYLYFNVSIFRGELKCVRKEVLQYLNKPQFVTIEILNVLSNLVVNNDLSLDILLG